SGTGIDPAWHAAYHKNRAARMSPEEQRRLAELQEQLSRAQGAEFAALDRAYCELVFSSDLADRSRVSELAGSLLVDGLHVNYEVNRLLGKDAQRFAESDDMRERLAGLEVPTLVIHGEADLRPAW